MKYRDYSFLALSGVLLAAVATAFWPITSGTFLFDDFANLKSIGEYGPIRDIDGLARYLTSGIADPLGRPVAMASFLADARDWPADPAPFLRSNLLLHLLNAVLLAAVLATLGRSRGLDLSLSNKAAAFAAALWAMHPLWVSTVGYVVQRHAMLATTFVLLGVLAWLYALAAFRQGNARRGWLWAGLAMPACGVLAALSKANGMLLPLLVLALHFFILSRPGEKMGTERHAVRMLLIVPSLLLVAALVLSINPDPAGRPWSLAERLLSQPRALADYLFHLAIPRVNSVGLFADGFEVSTSWRSPATTLPSLVFLALLAAAPFALRRNHPFLAGAFAFYLAGHVMESSVLPLELYFEHRSYLPAMMLGWPLALHLLSHPWQARTGPPILWLLLIILAFTTFQRASLWADTPRQAAVWARLLPDSPRAQTWAAQHEIEQGEFLAAETRLQTALDQEPLNAMLALNLLDIECAQGRVSARSVDRAAAALARTGADEDLVQSWLRGKIQGSGEVCPTLGTAILSRLLDATAEGSIGSNPASSKQRRLEAMFALSQRDCRKSLNLFLSSQAAQRWASEAYGDTALLASRCGPETGLSYLNAFLASDAPDASERFGMLQIHQWVLRRQGYWKDELLRLRAILREETNAPRPAQPPGAREGNR